MPNVGKGAKRRMYKLILVDDEADVREGVYQEIDWAGCGFEVTGRAENGREALEQAERWSPDVVVTDIRMPFMDGLQLSERIRAEHPSAKIIILTGFDEFEYARKAIRLGVEEFVLKPFSSREFMQALHKVKAKLDEEIAQKENVALLREHYRKSLPVLRESFLGSLMTRKLPEREIREKAAGYGLNLEGALYSVSVLQADPGGGPAEDKELSLFAVRNIAEEIAAGRGQGCVFQMNEGVVVLSVAARAEPDAFRLGTLAAMEEIRRSVEKYLKMTVTVGVGTVTETLSDLKFSYDDALAALDYRPVVGGNRVVAIEDVERRSPAPIRYDPLQEQALIRCLKVGTPEEMAEIVERLFDAPLRASRAADYRDVQLWMMQLAATLLKAAQETGQETGGLFGGSGSPLTELARFTDLREAKRWYLDACGRLMSRISEDRQASGHALVEEARRFTMEHYMDSELSTAKVCRHLHISPGYFSALFKRETNATYVQYLQNVRMEAAKELLLSTDLKAFEIAEKVGYADPNYFSFSFKKHVGLSPKDYRLRARGEIV